MCRGKRNGFKKRKEKKRQAEKHPRRNRERCARERSTTNTDSRSDDLDAFSPTLLHGHMQGRTSTITGASKKSNRPDMKMKGDERRRQRMSTLRTAIAQSLVQLKWVDSRARDNRLHFSPAEVTANTARQNTVPKEQRERGSRGLRRHGVTKSYHQEGLRRSILKERGATADLSAQLVSSPTRRRASFAASAPVY